MSKLISEGQTYKKVSLVEKYLPVLKYLIKRILLIIPVLLVISMIIFLLVNMMPGDPLNAFLNPEEMTGTVEEVAAKREYYTEVLGLNDPIHIRFVNWWKDILQGEFGYSVVKNKPVNEFIGQHIWNSFKVNIIAFIIAFIVAIFIGIKSAVKRGSTYDKMWSVFSITGISLPSFFLAMILVFIFSVNLQWLPFSGMQDPLGIRPEWQYYILPVTVVTLGTLAPLVKYVKNSMLEVLTQDYIRTARAKGLSEKVVIYRHAFRNALLPVITLVGFYIPTLFGGSIIVEKIFVWPGIGNLMNDAYNFKDRSVLTTTLLFFALLTLLGIVLQDIGYGLADPRIREGGSKDDK